MSVSESVLKAQKRPVFQDDEEADFFPENQDDDLRRAIAASVSEAAQESAQAGVCPSYGLRVLLCPAACEYTCLAFFL